MSVRLQKHHFGLLQVEVLRNMVATLWSNAQARPENPHSFIQMYGSAMNYMSWDKKRCINWLTQFDVNIHGKMNS